MMISTKGRYALRIMADLAKLEKETADWISIAELAKRNGISVKYLEALIGTINKGGFLKSKMGKNGGYRLIRRTEEYSVGEILRLAEGAISPVRCLEEGRPEAVCENAKECITLPLWKELDRLIESYLEKITLEDLINGEVEVPWAMD